MSLALLLLLGIWVVLVGVALLVARDRLGGGRASWRDEVLARGTAFLGATLLLAVEGFLLSTLGPVGRAGRWLPLAWLVSIGPLLLPPSRRASSLALVGASIGLTLASTTALALSILFLTTPRL